MYICGVMVLEEVLEIGMRHHQDTYVSRTVTGVILGGGLLVRKAVQGGWEQTFWLVSCSPLGNSGTSTSSELGHECHGVCILERAGCEPNMIGRPLERCALGVPCNETCMQCSVHSYIMLHDRSTERLTAEIRSMGKR